MSLSSIVKKDNCDCIEIYNMLKHAFHECSDDTNKYLNIVAIFFHDLMRILTSYYLKKNELTSPYGIDVEAKRFQLKEFPYIDF